MFFVCILNILVINPMSSGERAWGLEQSSVSLELSHALVIMQSGAEVTAAVGNNHRRRQLS